MKTTAVLIAFAAMLVLTGCEEKKMEPVPVGEMKEYRDPGLGWSISYPANWPVVNAQVGRARFYNATDVDAKFQAPDQPGVIGAEISVDVVNVPDPAAHIKKNISDMKALGIQITSEEQITMGEATATKVKYGANYGKGSIIYGHHIYLQQGDSTVYDLGFAGFGDFYDAHAAVFDASLKSFKPAKPKEPGRDETLPSETFEKFEGKNFSFEYPDNFNSTNPAKRTFEEVAELRGRRLDCSIRFDVFDAKGLTLDKVFEQNKSSFRGASAGNATVGGQPAKTLTGAATKDVMRKMYFVVHNNKVVRITTDWFRPQSAEYTAAYDKVIGSVRLK